MRLPLISLLTAATLLMSGCDRGGDSAQHPEAATTPQASTPAAPAPTPVAAEAKKPELWFEPDALSSCEKAGKVMVHWDVSAIDGIKVVNVMTLRPNGEEGMFAPHARPAGTKETGTWMRAGRELLLRNADDGSEIARATLGSLPCATDPAAATP